MWTAAKIIFWMCVSIVAYTYAGYPVLIFVLSRAFGKRASPPDVVEAELPLVSVLIAVHNEESVIEQRINNALQLDYPADKLEIVIASDGSDDRTVELASGYGHRVRVANYAGRRGKAATVNTAARDLNGQIVLFSDANTSIDHQAVRKLVRWFGDGHVGVVCGRLVLIDSKGGNNVDGVYWRYETFMKTCEGRLGALVGANGAIYAIRRDVFESIPAGTVVDDLVIPMLARMRRGCGIVYDEDALGWEETPSNLSEEFRRRVRIGSGGFQSLAMLWPILDPRRGWIALAFLSHKVLRWVCPLLLLSALGASAALCHGDAIYRWALAAQICFYGFCAATWKLANYARVPRVLRLASMFAGMNAALFLGLLQWMRGRPQGTWRRTERTATSVRQAA
jgi:cellulose synthase/poly-beta-1,6-N-acetylglucosamine synthase-like glycosyltransferase